MRSCIYEGLVTHCRHQPLKHGFQYRLCMLYMDLAETDALVGQRRLIANHRLSARSFLRSDHLFHPELGLADEIRKIVREQTGRDSRGPIRLLTQLRYWGYYFSPLNLFYIFDQQDSQVEFIVAEVSNTPWKERHCYVLWEGNRKSSGKLHFSHEKQFHVSPFLGMDMSYHWRLTPPGERLNVSLANRRENTQLFDAHMTLNRRPLNRQQLLWMNLRYPWMTAQIVAAIHVQALKLWWKKCPVYSHPRKQASAPPLDAKVRNSPPKS